MKPLLGWVIFSLAVPLFSPSAEAQTAVPLPDRHLVKLAPDPARAKVYGLNFGDGTGPGSLLAFRAADGMVVGEIQLGIQPTDMSILQPEDAAFVINTGSRTIMKVDLQGFAVLATRAISTPDSHDLANPLRVAAGPFNRVYFTDGGWSPGMHLLDFATGTILGSYDDDSGVGGMALTRDGGTIYTWRQYGWGAGDVNSWVTRFDASEVHPVPLETSFVSWRRDPLDTPILLNVQETLVFNKQQVFAATNVVRLQGEFEENIYAISSSGDLACGPSKIFHTATLFAVTHLPFSTTIQTISRDDQTLFLYASNPSQLWAYPLSLLVGAGWETNAAPVARFVWSPASPTTRSVIEFDATDSTDDQGGGAALTCRWDWESDGVFDTPFTNALTVTYRFANAGTKTVTVQVKDGYGATGSVAHTFDVVHENDPDLPGGGNPQFEIQFVASDIAFDPVRPYAYVSGYDAKRLVALNLTNGLIEKQFSFDTHPESIAVSPDGKKLYLALLRRPHSPYWFGGHVSDIVEFDLEKLVKSGQYEILADPGDMAVTDAGILIIAGGSDQWTELQTYRASTGELLGSGMVYQGSRVSLHPSQAAVYLADTGLSPSDIRRYDFDPLTGVLLSGWDSPYHGEFEMAGNVWCHPDATHVLVRGGLVLTSSEVQSQDMQYVRSLAGGVVEDLTFDVFRNALFTVGNQTLNQYHLETLELAMSQTLGHNLSRVRATPQHLFVAWTEAVSTLFLRLPNPSAGGETNLAPVARFVWSPASPTTRSVIEFDASGSSDDQPDPSKMSYRWDWESDGVYDTDFTNLSGVTHGYNIAGTKIVTLQVKDRYGATGQVAHRLDVTQEDDPGVPGGGNPEFEVQFAASDIAFDPVRPYAYVSSYEAKLLAVLNLTNGLIERQFSFQTHPESIAISPDGKRLYLALLRRPHSGYWFDGHLTDVAEFDLERQVKVREFQIPADPGDMAVTDQGILIIAGGSDQWTELQTYRVPTGELLGSSTIYQGARLSLHPSQAAVYAADTGLSPSDIQRYAFDPLTGVVTSAWDSPYHGDYEMGGGVWCHPDGEQVLVRGGGIFTSSPIQGSDLRYVTSLPGGMANAVAFDVPHEALFTVNNGQLNHYHLQTYELLLSLSLSNDAHDIHATPEALYVARVQGNRTHFERLHNYALPHPFILQSPRSAEVKTSTPVLLSVTAIGALPLSYQWFHDGNPLSGAVAQSLSFGSVQDSDSGDYYVVLGNSYGSVTSAVARLTVLSPPIITEEPKNLTVSAGQSTTLFVRAGGHQPLHYQWSFEGLPLPGQTTDTLVLHNLQSSNAGAYRVSVHNVAGTALSSVAILRVTPAFPAILTEPVDTMAPAGESVELRVVAAGTEPLSYQWRYAGLNLTGATQPTLQLFNVQAADSGAYQVMVTNTLGAAQSVEATLTVLPAAPRFTLQPADVMAGFGTQITLRAAAVGSEPISFQWRRGNDLVLGATYSVLSLTNLTLESAGAYSVVAANEHGATNSAVAQVTVVTNPPTITEQPADASLLVGDRLALQVFATGSPPLTWAWFHQHNPMPARTNSMLVVEPVSVADGGEYYARISNSFGSVTSSVAVVSVHTPPALAHGLTNVAVDAGSDVLLAVQVNGDAPLSYTWKFNGRALGTSDSSSIILEDVTTTHAGSYHVSVENPYGSADSRMTLTVFGSAGTLQGWGDNLGGQSAAPTNVMDVVRMAGGDFHSLALRRDGTVVAWGDNSDGQTTIPVDATNVVAVAAGAAHSLALRLDGQVLGWGRNDFLQSAVPPAATSVVAIAAGEGHSVALRQDGSVVIWGDTSLEQGWLPAQLGFVVAVAAGRNHTVALRNDGRVFAWGMNSSGQASVPILPSGIKAIAAGYLHNLALSSHGTVIAWGDNSAGQTDVPAGLSKVVAVAAGELHSLALTSSGRVIVWGDGTYGQREPSLPTWHVASIAAGYYHNLAAVLPRLDVAFPSGTMVLSWERPYMLQSSPELQGPYHDVSPGGSWTNQLLSLPQQFYRLKISP